MCIALKLLVNSLSLVLTYVAALTTKEIHFDLENINFALGRLRGEQESHRELISMLKRLTHSISFKDCMCNWKQNSEH